MSRPSWCASPSDPTATYTVAFGASSTVTTIAMLNPWGSGLAVATGRFELYAVGDTPGVDPPQFDSGTLAFSAAGEITYTLPSAESGIGSVRLVVESTPTYACIGEIGLLGTQP